MRSCEISRLVHCLAKAEKATDECDLALIEDMVKVLADYWDETPEQVSVMVIELCSELVRDAKRNSNTH